MRKLNFIVWFAIIAGLTIVVYSPSLLHLFRAEAYSYFVAFQGKTVMVTEPLLFRPLLDGIFKVQYSLFGMNYLAWRITALGMHLIAIFCLLRLLWSIKPSIFAVLVTLWFSVMYASINSVLYLPVAAYMLALALILTALYYLRQGVEQGHLLYIYIAFSCVLVAGFIHEVSLAFAILMGVYLWLERERLVFDWARANLGCLSIIIYLAIYISQKANNVGGLLTQYHSTVDGILYGLGKLFYVSGVWVGEILSPTWFNLSIEPRFQAQAVVIWHSFTNNLPVLINFIVLAALVYAIIKSKSSHSLNVLFLIMLYAMLVVYILAILLFRVYSVGLDYIIALNNAFNIFWAILLVIGYILLFTRRFNKTSLNIACAALLLLIGFCGYKTFQANYRIAAYEQSARNYLGKIYDFVQLYNIDQDISIKATTDGELAENLQIDLYGVDKERNHLPFSYSVPEILYFKVWDNTSPKYTLHYLSQGDVLECLSR